MSTDTIALFEVANARAAVEVIRACAVREMPAPLRAVGQRYLECWRPKQWEYDDHHNLLGPGGFSIRAKDGIVEAYHLLPYSTFALQEHDGHLVLNAFQFVGRLVGSAEMIIIHEMLPWEGVDLDAIAQGIVSRIGPPARDWDQLRTSDLFKPGCWMRVKTEQVNNES